MPRSNLAFEFDEKKVDAVFAELDQCRLPGAAVGIAVHGRPVYRKGFGLANMELPVVLTPSMRMRIGSATKHMTCLTYLLLCEEGKASVDDPLGKYLPELNSVTHRVTIRQLMGHTGGLRDAANIRFQFSGMGGMVSTSDLLSLYRDIDTVNAPPCTSWMYSNGAYVLLSEVVERISGQSLGEAMASRIFRPLEMNSTLLRRWDADFVENSATPHMTNPDGQFERPSWGLDFSGGGAVVSTVDDMLHWLRHMDSPVVGSAETWKLMKSPQVLSNGSSTGYGLGLVTGRYRGVETLYHIGGWLGASAQVLKVPAVGVDIAIMVNRHDVSAPLLADQVLDACIRGLEPPANVPAHVIGTFISPRTGRVVQLYEKQGQQVASIDGYELVVEADSEGTMSPAGALRYVKQSLTPLGDPLRPSAVRLSDFGNQDELKAVQPEREADLKAVVGTYRSDSADVEATVSAAGESLKLVTKGRFGSMVYDDLKNLAQGVWLARPTGGAKEWFGSILSFTRDGLTFRSYAIPSPLLFQRVV